MKGIRNILDVLWDIPITKPILHTAHSIITRDKTKIELIQYSHGFCFSPTPGTFLENINNGNFFTLLGLNNPKILKHLLPRIATALGNIYQEWNNLQSTKLDIRMISLFKTKLDIEEDKYFILNLQLGLQWGDHSDIKFCGLEVISFLINIS